MKRLVLVLTTLVAGQLFAQEGIPGNFSGSLESNSQWLHDDENLEFEAGDERFRSNNYFRLDYTLGNVSTGVQYEAYLPTSMLGYSDRLEGNGIATYYARYKNEKLDLTAGNFYDQFGSGLIYRSWEDRQIGINNSLRGVRVGYTPNDYTTVKGILGKQRWGFDETAGTIHGIDAETNLLKFFNKNSETAGAVNLGASYVGKYEEYSGSNDVVPANVASYAVRMNYFGNKGLYGGAEYVLKGKDVIVQNGTASDRMFDGNAFLLNLGYSQKGFGINSTFRRLENMGFFSQRNLSEPAFNQFNEGNINYLPALTRQHDYLLTNIYVYQAQPHLNFLTQQIGEIGGQVDIFYNFPKETLLGGKYGTKLAVNGSYWNGINADFANGEYKAGFLDFGKKFFHDVNFEVSKKWSPDFSSIFTYMHQYYDKGIVEGGNYSHLIANVVVADLLYKITPRNSVRAELQHLQTKREKKNWAAAVLEYNHNFKWSFYATDMYNYGNDNEDDRFHYYSVGGSYTENTTRVQLNYGRQRGGLICVGGVCRYVPENNGLTLNLQYSF